jgi:hypothetical protein
VQTPVSLGDNAWAVVQVQVDIRHHGCDGGMLFTDAGCCGWNVTKH